MDQNKPATPLKRKRSDRLSFLILLKDLLPQVDLDKLWATSRSLAKSPRSKGLLTTLATQRATLDNGDKQELLAMYKAGYDIEHLLLYAVAPQVSHLGNETTKEQYLELWNKDNNFKQKASKSEIITRTGFATSALMAISGSIIVFGSISLGLVVDNPGIVKTGYLMGDWTFGIVKTLRSVIEDSSANNIAESIIASLGAGLAIGNHVMKDKVKQSRKIDLRERLYLLDVGQDKKEELILSMNKISKPIQHLISHFTQEELMLFLDSNDELRKKMWITRAPNYEQQCMSVLADDGNWATKWRKKLQLTCATWENKDNLDQPISLMQSLKKFRDMKNDNSQVESNANLVIRLG